jgi:DNA invertase Pin-like site-specific DNA recombinase
MIQLEWLMDQIDLYCAQGAEEVAAEEDSTMTYKEAYRDYLEHYDHIRTLNEAGMKVADIAKELNCSRQSVYVVLRATRV